MGREDAVQTAPHWLSRAFADTLIWLYLNAPQWNGANSNRQGANVLHTRLTGCVEKRTKVHSTD